MIPNYGFIGLLLFAAIGFALAPVIVVALIAPRKRSFEKGETYECGVRTTGETWVRFRVQYYIYAILFLVFDIETVFLFPWAVSYLGLAEAGFALFVLVEMVIFLAMLAVGLAYAWASGDLRWV